MWIWIVALLVVVLALRARAAGPAAIASAALFVEASYGRLVEIYSTRAGVPRLRVKAMILRESMGNKDAVGKIGERGLMQLTQGALSDVNRNFSLSYSWGDMFDPEKNIRVGTLYLQLQLQRFGDIDTATQAYNAGAGAVEADPGAGFSYLQAVKAIEQTL